MAKPRMSDDALKAAAERAREQGADTPAKIRKVTGASEARIKRVLGEDPGPGGKTPSTVQWERVEVGAHLFGTMFGSLVESRCHGHADGSPSCGEVFSECRGPAEKELVEYARHNPRAAKILSDITLPGEFGGVLIHLAPLGRSVMRAHVVPGLARRRAAAEQWEQETEPAPSEWEPERAPDLETVSVAPDGNAAETGS